MMTTRYGVISWNGLRSDNFGIQIEEYPNIQKPQRKLDRYVVPGRNGDIIMMQDAWENVQQKYTIVAGDGEKHSVSGGFGRVAEWLNGPTGYAELWDDFDPDHFRLAYFEGPFDAEVLSIGRVGRTTITFNCKPQRYLLIGRDSVEIDSAPTIVYNPTVYASQPLIFVEGSAAGTGTVSIGNVVLTITDIPENGMYIDCEEMDCRDTNGNNMNAHVASSTGEFAKLLPGENTIGFTGAVASLSITPRWFEI